MPLFQHHLEALTIPGLDEPFGLALPKPVQALRQDALDHQALPGPRCLDDPMVMARAWQTHTADEPWLIWRARLLEERLQHLPLDLDPRERLTGKPLCGMPDSNWQARAETANDLTANMPKAGGDAGHFHPDWERLLDLGIPGLVADIEERQQAEGLDDENHETFKACHRAAIALRDFAVRLADTCTANAADDPANAAAWEEKATVCHNLANEAPATFREAMQLQWLATIALWFGEGHGLTTPGRLDQVMRSFYEADLAAGRITRDEAFLWICDLFIQCNRILHAGSAISVMVGGRDADGNDVTNELTYLVLAARLATGLIYPTVGLCWHPGTPAEYMDFTAEVLATGIGCPAIFNDELIAEGLRDHGVNHADSYNYMNSTCVEIKVVGRSNMWVTAPYYNCPKKLLAVMADIADGKIEAPADFDGFKTLVKERLRARVAEGAAVLDQTWRDREQFGGFPLASCVIRDCLEKGRDFDRGGARYNWVENSFVGLANLIDSSIAVRELVYRTGELSIADFYAILDADFAGHKELRQRLINDLPRYGNDDPEADELAREWADWLVRITEEQTVGLHRYVPGFFCWIMHGQMGSQTMATPDGRPAHAALADGAGAAQGSERRGPTASLLSTTCWNHRPAIGGLVHNAKFTRSVLKSKQDRKALVSVVETYMNRGGFELQVNVVDTADLRRAKVHPEEYRDLVVRVAGYSDYFVHLPEYVQDEVIQRNEHALV